MFGLADTGADSNLVPGGLTKILGCAINAGVPNPACPRFVQVADYYTIVVFLPFRFHFLVKQNAPAEVR